MSLLNKQAPEFSLVNSETKITSLSDFKGHPVVVAFFPLAFTSVCTKELCTFRDNLSAYENLSAKVLAISVDSPFTLDVFKKQQNLNFPLLSDFNKEVSKKYGVLYDVFPALGLQGVSKRAIFILDKNHSIVHEEICASPGDMPNLDTIAGIIGKL